MNIPDKLVDFLFEHYKSEYEFQRDRTENLRDRISFVVGFLTILGGALTYFISTFPHAWHCGRTLIFYFPLGVTVALFAWSVGTVLWVIGGRFLYQSIPLPSEIQRFSEQLTTWNGIVGGSAETLMVEMHRSLLESYKQAAEHNFSVNRSRTDRLLLATRIVVVAFVLSGAILPGYLFEKSHEEKKPTLVRLVSSDFSTNKWVIKYMADNSTNTSATTSSPQPSATPTPVATASPQSTQTILPPKPAIAPNQLLTEGSVRMISRPVDTKSAE